MDVEDTLGLDGTSDSFVEWMPDAEASWFKAPFFRRLAPDVVEPFQTSCISKIQA